MRYQGPTPNFRQRYQLLCDHRRLLFETDRIVRRIEAHPAWTSQDPEARLLLAHLVADEGAEGPVRHLSEAELRGCVDSLTWRLVALARAWVALERGEAVSPTYLELPKR